MTRVRVLAFVAAVLAVSPSSLRADRYDDALKTAQANMATPAGRAYADNLAAFFDQKKLRDALVGCAESLSPEDAPPFTVLMQMSGDGQASQVLLRPPAPVAVCLRWVLRETTFPKPPAAGYWVTVDLDSRRSPGAPVIPTPGVATASVPPTRTPSAPTATPSAPPPTAAAMPTRVPAAATFLPTATPTSAAAPPKSAAAPSEGIHVDSRAPDLATLRRSLAGTSGPIGPLLAQSDGVAADDARLEPYWSLAEEMDRPIAISLGPEPAGTTSPRYRVALGDPLKLEGVLARHPKLRVIVVGAGWPFGDAMAGLMQRYSQVRADVRPLVGVLPDAELQAYVRRLADAGLGVRIISSAN